METVSSEQPRKGRRAASTGAQPAAADLADIQMLYDTGRAYDAYRTTLHFAPLRDWRDPEARVLAGRLAHHLGAPMMADSLMILAWRRAPENLHARYFGIRALLSRRGPLEALDAMQRYPVPTSDPILHAEWLALNGHILGAFRDFARAEALLAEARRVAPEHHWIALEAASLFGMQDRLDEALAEARRGFALQPLHPGATLAQAQILLLLARTEEAIGVLEAAMQTMQSSTVAAFLASLLTEHERYADALQAWQVCQVLMPLIEKPTQTWLYGHLSHMQYLVGNIEESKRLAMASGDPHLASLGAKLDESPSSQYRRHKLDVPFIKQHHVTCVPTTMAMLGRYWGEDLEHLAIAEQITYGGTPTHRERQWAEAHGWIVREITLTWETAVALLDRGVPFTLTTASGDIGHEQAIAGYDTHRRSLLIRDPSSPGLREIDFESLMKAERSSGPRAMIMLPQKEAQRLDGVELPEAEERDGLHRMLIALDRHDRGEAEKQASGLGPRASERVAHLARQTLALYDHDAPALLRSVDEELAIFPGDTQLLMQKQRCLAELSRGAERKTLLRELATSEGAHPIFLRIYGEAIGDSAAQHETALVFLRRYLRNVALDPEGLRMMANVKWAAQRFDEATALYRLAASLGETNESMATSYFIAAALTGKQEEALEFLRDRARRASHRSSLPWRTLFWALDQLFRIDEAFEGLKTAMELRPDDGELVLFAADWYARFSRPGVEDLLAKAEPITRRADFLATRAAIYAYRGELQKALADWRQVLELQPLSTEAHHAVAQLLEQIEGKPAVIRFLEEIIERFPGYRPAHAFLAGATRDSDPVRHERAIRRLIDIAPNDAWAHRELAVHFANSGRFDDALAETARAEEISPADAAGPTVRGRVLMLAGRMEEARQAFLRAIDIVADEPYAISFIGGTAVDAKEREALHDQIFQTLVAKTAYGEGLLAWYDVARSSIAPQRLLELVTEAVNRRGDLWQSHSILIQQLTAMERKDDAVLCAEKATARFPLQTALWMSAAAAYRAAGNRDKEADALETALHIDATNADAAAQLALLLQSRNEDDRAIAILSAAAAAAPLDATVQWMLATAQWMRGEKENALARISRAAKLAPDNSGIWGDLVLYAQETGRPEVPRQVAAQLTDEKPGNAMAWLALASTEESLEAKLAAIDRAIAVDPTSESAYDRKAVTLAEAGRFAEAYEACAGAGPERRPSLVLRGREAWVLARQGDVAGAVEKMNAILRDEPNYGWGWYQLCQWHASANQNEKYREAARQLARVSPDSALAWNHLGEAERVNGDEKTAEECFRKAAALDPGNVFASLSMIDMHLEHRRIVRAEEVLDAAEKLSKHPAFRLKRLEIAIRRKQREDVLRIMAEMASDATLDPELVLQGITRLRQTGYGDELRDILQRCSQELKMNPAAASEHVQILLGAKKADAALSVIGKLRGGDKAVAREAAISYLDAVANRREGPWLDSFLGLFPSWAAEDIEVWGMIGFCDVCLNRYHDCVSAMSDWADRKGVRPGMLLNLALSYRHTGDEESGARVNELALQLPEDPTTPEHHVWVAFDEAMAGKYERADKRISAVPFDRLNSVHQQVARCVWAIVMAAREKAKGGKWRRAAQEQLQLVINAQFAPITRKCYSAVIRKFRKDFAKGFWESLWAWRMAGSV